MVRGLGLPVATDTLPFEPEAGAYSGHSHPNILLKTHSHG
jgi:urease accessory protein UreE